MGTDARPESAALEQLLNDVLSESLDPEGCIPIWRLHAALRDDEASRAHVNTCKHCQNLLSLLFQDKCPHESQIEVWAPNAAAPERAALMRHIDRDDCTACRDAFASAIAAASEHPTPWEIVREQLGLLSERRQRVIHEHVGSGCEVCRNVAASGGTQRLADLVSRLLSTGRDWRRIVSLAQSVSLAPQASYSVDRGLGRAPLAQIQFPSMTAVLHQEEDTQAITLDVTVSGTPGGRSVTAVVASSRKCWEQRIVLEASGSVAHGSAVIGSPQEWVADDHVSVLVWLEE